MKLDTQLKFMTAPRTVLFFLFVTLVSGCASTPAAVSSTASVHPTGITGEKTSRMNADAAEPGKPSPYTFERLQSAAQYLSAVIQKRVDEKFKGVKLKSISSCDPTQAQAEAMIMGLQSLIDTESEHELQEYLSTENRTLVKSKHWDQCGTICLCGDYAELIEKIDSGKRSEFDTRLQQELRKEHAMLSRNAALTCAQAAQWFCKSDLRHELLERLK